MDVDGFAAWVRSRHSIDVDWSGEVTTTSVAHRLATEVNRLIAEHDRTGLAHAYETMRKAFLDGDAVVRNDVIVSGLAKVNLADSKKAQRAWVRDLVPEVLRVNLADYRDYLEHLLAEYGRQPGR